jgi:hypothetical protein
LDFKRLNFFIKTTLVSISGNFINKMKKEKTNRINRKQVQESGHKAGFDWLLFSFIAFVITLLVLLLSFR